MLNTRHWDRHKTGGLNFTELGFGTAPLGNLYKAISDAEARATLDQAWESGMRYFDTAPLYGLGLSETRLNGFLRDKPRDQYLLSSKVGRIMKPCAPEARTGLGKWFDVPQRQEQYDYSYDGVMRSVEFSLERLGVSRIDILYVMTYAFSPMDQNRPRMHVSIVFLTKKAMRRCLNCAIKASLKPLGAG
jgi:D-threo-aldose 1-dehydrogenase